MNCTDLAAREHGDYWEFLSNDSESFRYAVIANCVRRRAHPGSSLACTLLDAGCGSALLRQYLPVDLVKRYVGVDHDHRLLVRADVPACDQLRYGNLEEPLCTDESFDVIVFNEVLYYLRDPIAAIERCLPALRPEGRLIISTFFKPYFWGVNNRCLRQVLRYLRQRKAIEHQIGLKNGEAHWSVIVSRRP